MPEIPETRIWPDPRCAVTLTRNGPMDERDAELADLLAEVRRLRAVAVAAEAYRDAEDARDAADAQFGPLAPNSDEDRVRRARAMERDTREALDSALRAAGIGGGA